MTNFPSSLMEKILKEFGGGVLVPYVHTGKALITYQNSIAIPNEGFL